MWYDRGKHILIWAVPAAASRVDGFDTANSINIDLKITHYNIYITDIQTEQVTIYTSDVTSLMIADNNVPCSASVQVSAVNPAGEGQRSPGIEVNCKKISPACDHSIEYCATNNVDCLSVVIIIISSFQFAI